MKVLDEKLNKDLDAKQITRLKQLSLQRDVIAALNRAEVAKQLKLTKVIVAHRPETIASADRVLVMDGGRIVQELRPNAAPVASVVPSAAAA